MSDTTTRTTTDRRNRTRALEVALLGLGPVGQGVARAALDDPRFDLRACVDPRDDREVVANDAGFSGATFASADELSKASGVAILCTQSALAEVAPSIETLLLLGFDVVTSCEEMIAPQLGDREVVEQLDRLARSLGRTVLGSGVNPGFVMDYLPFVATSVARQVTQIRVTRRVDVSTRRERLQQKVGMGISLDEFNQRRDAGTIGHVGLRGSLVFLASALGWEGESYETVDPVPAADGGSSLGVRHVAEVSDQTGEVRVRGLLEMYDGVDEVDEIEIDGTPPARIQLVGGISGDEATISAILNAAARIPVMESGLQTLDRVPPPAWSSS